MTARDNDENEFRMGLLDETEAERMARAIRGEPPRTPTLNLNFGSGRVAYGQRPKVLILRFANIQRGKEGTATFNPRGGWCDYMDRTGRYSGRKNDLVGTSGADRPQFTDLVCAVKDAARRWNDSIVLRGVVVFPNGFSDKSCTNVLNAMTADFESTGVGSRKCYAKITRMNLHPHSA